MKIHEILQEKELEQLDEGLMDMVRAGGRLLGGVASLPGAALGTIAGAGRAFAKGYKGAKATVGLDPIGPKQSYYDINQPGGTTPGGVPPGGTPPGGKPPGGTPPSGVASISLTTEFMKLSIPDIKALLDYYKRVNAFPSLGITAEARELSQDPRNVRRREQRTAKRQPTTTATPQNVEPQAQIAPTTSQNVGKQPAKTEPGQSIQTSTTTQNVGSGPASQATLGGVHIYGPSRSSRQGAQGAEGEQTPKVKPGRMSPQAIAIADEFAALSKEDIIKLLDKYKIIHNTQTLNIIAESRK